MPLIIPAIASFLISLLLTPLTIRFAQKYGFVDDPKKHKHPAIIHKGIIPRAGGIPVFLAILTGVLLFLPIQKALVGILLGGFILVLIGTLDDKYDLNPYLRLFLNFAAALVVVGFGVGISYITNPLGGVLHLDQFVISLTDPLGGIHKLVLIADIFAFLWIIFITNATSWSSGVDGQLSGVTVIAAIILGLAGLKYFSGDPTQLATATLAFIVAGAYLGFLPYHIFPQKIMPGYGGASLAGFLLATLAILSGAKLATALIVLGIPVADAIWAILRRLAAGKSPVWGDKLHLHHRLLALGWGRRRIAFTYWVLCAILGTAALELESSGKAFVLMLILLLVGGGLFWLRSFLSESSGLPDQDSG